MFSHNLSIILPLNCHIDTIWGFLDPREIPVYENLRKLFAAEIAGEIHHMLSKALFTVYETFHIDVHQVAMLGFFKTSGQVLRFVAFRCAESCSYFVHILSFLCSYIV